MPNEIFPDPLWFTWPGEASGKLLGPWERRQQKFAAPVGAPPLPGAGCPQGCRCRPRGMQPAQLPRCQQPLGLYRKPLIIGGNQQVSMGGSNRLKAFFGTIWCTQVWRDSRSASLLRVIQSDNEIENIPSAASAVAAASATSCALDSCSASAIKMISVKYAAQTKHAVRSG